MNCSNIFHTFVFIIGMFLISNAPAAEIHDAAIAGDLDKIQKLIEENPALLELADKDGHTPLYAACRGKGPDYLTQVDVANFLLDKGANVKVRSNWGGTPLMSAILSIEDGEYELIQRLIDNGIDVNAKLKMNRHWTAMVGIIGAGDVKVAKLLIDHGADINVVDIEGTPLQQVIIDYRSSIKDSLPGNKFKMAKLLIENGAKFQEFSFGNSELHLAAMRGFADLVPVLAKHGLDVNAINDYGHTPLFYAVRHKHHNTTEALITAGANKPSRVQNDKTKQLIQSVKQGEAYLWNMICEVSPRIGHVVKTQNHVLIFNPDGINYFAEAGLSNGYLNPKELAGQNMTVLSSQQRILQSNNDVTKLDQALPDIHFILNDHPNDADENNPDTRPYHLAKSNESFSINGIQVHTIRTASKLFGKEGLGYLVEVDDLKIFHAGLHGSRNRESQLEKFKNEIDFLKPFGPIDFAILPIRGRHINIDYEPYLYLIDQLNPKAIYLIGEELNTEEHLKCLEVLKARNVPVFYPDGGVAVGQRFHYQKPDAPKYTDLDGDYLGQTPPGDTPVVFAPGIISGKQKLHCFPSLSSDGKEIVWMTLPPKIFYTKIDLKWRKPQEISFSKKYRCMFPVFSYDNRKLYFASNNIPGGFGSVDIWYVEKNDTGYSEPVNIGAPVNTAQLETQPVFTETGSIYYTGHVKGKRWDRGILYAEYKDGKYLTPRILDKPINIINPTAVDYTPFIARDEKYLLFSSNRHNPTREHCLIYISFKDSESNWTNPVNLSNEIEFNEDSRDPYVSPDGKYLFFCSDKKIYWMDTKILDRLWERREITK